LHPLSVPHLHPQGAISTSPISKKKKSEKAAETFEKELGDSKPGAEDVADRTLRTSVILEIIRLWCI